MNAIDFLVKEHNKVRGLLADMNDPCHREQTKRKLFDTIHDELIRHEEMEQKVWYPYLRAESNKRLNDRVKHLISEEFCAKKLMAHLSRIKNSDNFEHELIKLQKDVEHHATEEETELFPQVQKLFDESELQMIGKKMKEFKKTH